jgi:hypothetical protein
LGYILGDFFHKQISGHPVDRFALESCLNQVCQNVEIFVTPLKDKLGRWNANVSDKNNIFFKLYQLHLQILM